MVQSTAKTVAGYLKELPAERRAEVTRVLGVLRKHMPKGFAEDIGYGMIGWTVPLSRYPDTYNGQPLAYVGLAAQKNSYSLYLIGCYMDSKQTKALADAFKKEGKKLDMGKSCVRFKSAADLPLDAIGKLVGSCSVDDFIAAYEKSRAR